MKRIAAIKKLNKEEMAKFLCKLIEYNPCSHCPATEYCYEGHTGYLDWLDEEIESEKDL